MPPEPTAPSTGPRVLLVEDDPLHQMVGRRLLERLGARVDIAADGVQALARVSATAYDLVFMDLDMPGMDGLAATRAIRHLGLDGLPVVAMTGSSSPEDRQACAAAGMNDLVPKPVDARHLAETLASWLRAGDDVQPAADTPAAPEPDGLPCGIPGFDAAGALARMLGRQDLYRDMLARWTESQPALPGQLREALAGGDTAGALRLAHTARSLAATVGATGVAARAGALERLLREAATAASVHATLADLERDLRTTLSALSAAAEPA